jgi:hypothetical protein
MQVAGKMSRYRQRDCLSLAMEFSDAWEVENKETFFHSEEAWTLYRQIGAPIKKKIKFSSYIRKFRLEQLQSRL